MCYKRLLGAFLSLSLTALFIPKDKNTAIVKVPSSPHDRLCIILRI